MALALFDLDNTLIAGDSDHAWGEFLVEQGYVDGDYYRQENDRFYQLYQAAQLNIRDYLEFALKPLADINPNILTQLREQFLQEKIVPMQLKKAEQLIAQHKNAGDELVIITSTNRFVTEPIANLLAIDNLLATELEIDNERYTGRPAGEPCFREGKIKHLQAWLAHSNHHLENSFFYSDSINDLPLLEIVNTPVAVDPDTQLRAHAEAKGWEILSLRGCNDQYA